MKILLSFYLNNNLTRRLPLFDDDPPSSTSDDFDCNAGSYEKSDDENFSDYEQSPVKEKDTCSWRILLLTVTALTQKGIVFSIGQVYRKDTHRIVLTFCVSLPFQTVGISGYDATVVSSIFLNLWVVVIVTCCEGFSDTVSAFGSRDSWHQSKDDCKTSCRLHFGCWWYSCVRECMLRIINLVKEVSV